MKDIQRYLVVTVMILVAALGLPLIFPGITKPDSEKLKKAESSLVLPS